MKGYSQYVNASLSIVLVKVIVFVSSIVFNYQVFGKESVSDSEGTVAIVNVNVIPMTKDVILDNHTVIVAEKKIVRICRSEVTCIPDGATIIEGKDRYLLPGLSDMHAHVGGLNISENDEEARKIQAQQLRQYITFGVLTIRDPAATTVSIEGRNRINSGKLVGPRMFVASQPIDGDPPSYPTPFLLATATREAAVEEVKRAHAAGYDMIKVYNLLPVDSFDAVMDFARDLGMPVVAHVPVQVELEHALEKGVRSIEHMTGFDQACARGLNEKKEPLRPYLGWAYCTPEKIKVIAELASKYPVWVDPTLVAVDTLKTEFDRYSGSGNGADAYMPKTARQYFEYLYRHIDPIHRATMKGTRSSRIALVKGLSDAGVPLLTGTDTMASGYDLHREIGLLVDAGLTPYQALTASTSEPARFFDMEGEFGTIVEGASADFILLDADPLQDISNIKTISGLMIRGDWWDKSRIADERADLQKEYKSD